MKLVTFQSDEGLLPGVVINDRVVDLCSLDADLPRSVLGILEADDGLNRVRSRLAQIASEPPAGPALKDVTLKAPIQNPRKLLCIAGNYEDHIRESGREVGEKDKVTPRVFMKPASTTLCGPGDPILLFKHAQFIDYEAELAVVMGKRGKYIPAASALEYVAGYSCLNDISERKLLIRQRAASEPRDQFFDWLNGKWTDNSAPMGPWVVTTDEIADPQTLDFTLTVNGDVKQRANTGQMMFSVADLIHYISQFLTFEPGDVIATGTPAGVGKASEQGLRSGDVVEIAIEKIGTLSNPVSTEGGMG